MKVTIFKNITETQNPYYISIPEIIKRIKEGNSKDLVKKIRNSFTKEDRTIFKKQLPSICFSGEFEKRSNNGIKNHSGLVCLDFDHVGDVEKFKNHIKEDAHTMIAFISPSGDGIKAIIKIPANVKTHAASCRALKDYFKTEKLDDFKDVARVCFESYDPNIYYNSESSIFKDLINEEIKEIKTVEHANTSETFEKLKIWIEKFEYYNDGNKHKFLVKFAGALNRYGITEPETVNLLCSNYQYSATFVKTEHIEKIVQKVYSNYKHQFNISVFEKSGISIERKTGSRTNDNFFKEYEETENKKETLNKLLNECYIDFDEEISEPPTILSIRDIANQQHYRILTLGNISTIKGAWKSKKSFLTSMIASSLTANTEIFTNLVPTMLDSKRQVILFDTEQSRYDSQKMAIRIKKMSRTNAENFGSFSFRGLNGAQIVELIDFAVNEKFKEVGIIFIDQIADAVNSLNNEEEAVKVVRFLELISKEKDLHICNIVHVNKHDGYAQGWLGTQLMKKSETVIDIEKDAEYDNISHIKPSYTRGAMFPKFSIKINKYGYPEMLDDNDIAKIIDI